MAICFWIIGVLFYSSPIHSLPTVVPDRIPCLINLETGFFVEPIVNQALSLYNVRQELWLPINEHLHTISLEVPDRMKKRTAHMVPNPIEYPMQKGATAKILKEVLGEVFNEVLSQYPTHEMSNSHMIFEYIFSRQFPEFIRCFGQEVMDLKPKNL